MDTCNNYCLNGSIRFLIWLLSRMRTKWLAVTRFNVTEVSWHDRTWMFVVKIITWNYIDRSRPIWDKFWLPLRIFFDKRSNHYSFKIVKDVWHWMTVWWIFLKPGLVDVYSLLLALVNTQRLTYLTIKNSSFVIQLPKSSSFSIKLLLIRIVVRILSRKYLSF